MAAATKKKPKAAVSPASPSGPLYGNSLEAYITQEAQALKLDPLAVLGVASAEGGLSGAVGDQGTSFGPFQLHEGGALPSSVTAQGAQYAAMWANSPTGIDYALHQMANVAAGLTGGAAINSIVLRFERPADPTHDLQTASTYYATQGKGFGSGSLSAAAGAIGGLANTFVQGNEALLSGAENIASGKGPQQLAKNVAGLTGLDAIAAVITWPFKEHNMIRIGEVIAGSVLVLVGLLIVAKAATGSSASTATKSAVRKVPVARAAKAAAK
jgi:hypothetical protein